MARRKTHPGSIDTLRSGSVRIRLSVAGQLHTFVLKGVTERAARAIARKKHEELTRRAGRVAAGLPGQVPFSELIRRFEEQELPGLAPNTRKTYRASLSYFRRFFVERLRDPVLEEIQAGHVREYLAWRRHTGPGATEVSNYTIVKDRRLLHRLFVIAERLQLREGNPVAQVPSPKVDPRDPVLLSEGQLDSLLAELGHHPMAHTYVLLLAETGVRCDSEALHLRWDDLRLEEGFLWVASGRDGHRTKSGKGRWVPLTARLRTALQEHAARFRLQLYGGERSPWVFHVTRGQKRRGQRAGEYRGVVERATERAGLPDGWRLHDLRHRRVTTWLAQGKNPVHVKEAMGHSTIQVTMGYTHLAREHLRALVEGPALPAELKKLTR